MWTCLDLGFGVRKAGMLVFLSKHLPVGAHASVQAGHLWCKSKRLILLAAVIGMRGREEESSMVESQCSRKSSS